MGSCYASISGTCVLQVKEVPPRPFQYDGKIDVFELAHNVTSASLREEMARHGTVLDCQLSANGQASVQFATHAEAEQALTALRLEERAVAFRMRAP